MYQSKITDNFCTYCKVFAFSLLCFVLTGCGGSGSDTQSNDEPVIIEPEPTPESDQYVANPDLNETNNGMLNAVLTNRNPDCRAYVTDANNGDYSSAGINDRSNFSVDAPYFP